MPQSLSIVVAGRNDNYGGRFTMNLQQFLLNTSKVLPWAEIILVEWNPPAETPPISSIWPKGVKGRIITVPSEIHARIDNPKNLPLLEYWAKNVGIRRATKDFILATNPDTLIGTDLAAEIAGGLDSYTYYRTNRTDITPVNRGYEECRVIVSHTKWGSYTGLNPAARLTAVLRMLRRCWSYRTFNVPHENAAGDFLLASKSTWARFGGYPELSLASHVDSLMLCLLHKEASPYVFKGHLFHQDHERRPFLKNAPMERIKGQIMRGTLSLIPSPAWGIANATLEEKVMGPSG